MFLSQRSLGSAGQAHAQGAPGDRTAVGRHERGGADDGADLIVVDYDPYTAMNEGNFWGHMLFGMRGGQVRHAVVDGRVVMRDRQVLGLDEARLRARARTLSQKVWERFAANRS